MQMIKKHISPTKSALIYHILRARIVQMLSIEGFLLEDHDWYFTPVGKDRVNLVINDKGTDVTFRLNTKYEYLSGRTQFFLYESPNGGSWIGVKPNDIKYVNCKECSGRRFTIAGNKTDMVDNCELSITPCSLCNYNCNIGKE